LTRRKIGEEEKSKRNLRRELGTEAFAEKDGVLVHERAQAALHSLHH